jgi:hypothetical protein
MKTNTEDDAHREVATTLGERVKNLILSQRGQNIMLFGVFWIIAAILWFVMTLNSEGQRDMRCELKLVNVPDSVHAVSYLPPYVDVCVRGRGTWLMKYDLGSNPVIKIDYRYYHRGKDIVVDAPEMRTLVRDVFGANTQVLAMQPDTLHMAFTTRRPVRLAVKPEIDAEAAPNYIVSGPIKLSADSVLVYSLDPIPSGMKYVSATPVKLDNLEESKTVSIKLKALAGMRFYPDNITATINVEPVVSITRKLPVKTINVPAGKNLVLLTPTVDVEFLVPLSKFKDTPAGLEIIADYNDVDTIHSNMVAVKPSIMLKNVPQFFVLSDSIEYLIENK